MSSSGSQWLRLSLIVAVGTVMVLLAACAPATPPPTTPEVIRETVIVEVTPAPTPLPTGGELIVGCAQEPETIDPHVGDRGVECGILLNLYGTLLVKSPDGELLPWLVDSWEVSDDGLHYTLKLREDVKFHDGTPFNAEAVCFNFDRIVDPATESRSAIRFLGPYDSCEVVDEFTAQVNMKEPFGPFLEGLAISELGIVSPTAVQTYGDQYEMHQVGTGPFRWVEHVLNDHLTLERNPDYNWAPETYQHQGPAYLDKVTYRFIPESATREGALEIGEVHLINDVPPRDAARLGTNQDLALYNNTIPSRARHYPINVSKPPTDELAVRQAMNMAVDRQTIMSTLYVDMWPVSFNMFGPGILFYDQAVQDKYAAEYAYDPEAAGALLDEAGWVMGADGIRHKDGQPLKILLVAASGKQVHELVQAQLRAVGIDMEVEMAGVLDFFEKCGNGEANVCWLGGRVAPDPGLDMNDFLRSGGQYDWTKHQNARLNELLDLGVSTTDPQERQEIYSEVQDILMDQALILPVYWERELIVTNAEVNDLAFDLQGYPILYDVYLAR
jgi:peptide/nickel transport system substrate-binding protein